MVASDAGELLGEDLGLPVGQVGVLGHDGRLGHHNPRAGVLKVRVDADVIPWKKAEEGEVRPWRTLNSPSCPEETLCSGHP